MHVSLRRLISLPMTVAILVNSVSAASFPPVRVIPTVPVCFTWSALSGRVVMGGAAHQWFWNAKPRTEALREAVGAVEANETTLEDTGRAACLNSHHPAFVALTQAIHRQVTDLLSRVSEEDLQLSDPEKIDKIQALDPETAASTRKAINQFLSEISGNSRQIYFLDPPEGHLFFSAEGYYAGAHFDEASNAIYLSWPLIEALLASKLSDPVAAVQALAAHAAFHLDGMTHEEAADLHVVVSADLDPALEAFFEQQLAHELKFQADPEESQETESPKSEDASLTTLQKREIQDLTQGIVLRDPSAPEWLETIPAVMRVPKEELDENDWFIDQVRKLSTASRSWAESRDEALKEELLSGDWDVRLVYYAYTNRHAVCAYNHDIDWGFNFIHKPSGRRIQLGQNEFVWTPIARKSPLKREFERGRYMLNGKVPTVQRDLGLLSRPNNLKALLESDRLTDAQKVELKAFARIVALMPQCIRQIDIFEQEVTEEGRTLKLSRETLALIIQEAHRLAEEGKVQLPMRNTSMTERQEMRRLIAMATREGMDDVMVLWNAIAPQYSSDLRSGASFRIKQAAMGQIIHGIAYWLYRHFRHVQRTDWVEGDPLPAAHIQNVLSLGDACAVLARSMDDLKPALAGLGVRTDRVNYFSLDFAETMLVQGRQALLDIHQQTGRASRYLPLVANAVKGFLPVRDGSMDMVETGNFGTLGEGTVNHPAFRHHGLLKKIHFITEMRRVLRDGGYAVFTVRNSMPEQLYDILPLFGLRVLSQRRPELSFPDETLELLFPNDPEHPDPEIGKKRTMLRTLLRTGSYVVAYRDPRLDPLSLEELSERPEVLKAMEFDDSRRTGNHLAVSRVAPEPQSLDISNINVNDLKANDLRPDAISRLTLMEDAQYKDFISYLTCLQWVRDRLPEPDQGKLDRLLRLWDVEKAAMIPTPLIDFVYKTIAKKPTRPTGKRGPTTPGTPPVPTDTGETPNPTTEDAPRKTRQPRGTSLTFWEMFQKENERRAAESMPSVLEELRPKPPTAVENFFSQLLDAAVVGIQRITGNRGERITPDIVSALVSNPTPQGIAMTLQKMVRVSVSSDRILSVLESTVIHVPFGSGKYSRVAVQWIATFIRSGFQDEGLNLDVWSSITQRMREASIPVDPRMDDAVKALAPRLATLSWPERCREMFALARLINDSALRPEGFLIYPSADTSSGASRWIVRVAELEKEPSEKWALQGVEHSIPAVRVKQWIPNDMPDHADPQTGVTFAPRRNAIVTDAERRRQLARAAVTLLSEEAYRRLEGMEKPRIDRWRRPVWAGQDITFVEHEKYLAASGAAQRFYREQELDYDLSLGYSPAVKARAIADVFAALHGLEAADDPGAYLKTLLNPAASREEGRVARVTRTLLTHLLAEHAGMSGTPSLSNALLTPEGRDWVTRACVDLSARPSGELHSIVSHTLISNFAIRLAFDAETRTISISESLSTLGQVTEETTPGIEQASLGDIAGMLAGATGLSGVDPTPQAEPSRVTRDDRVLRAVDDVRGMFQATRHKRLINKELIQLFIENPTQEGILAALRSVIGLPSLSSEAWRNIESILRRLNLISEVISIGDKLKRTEQAIQNAAPLLRKLFDEATRDHRVRAETWNSVKKTLEPHIGAIRPEVEAAAQKAIAALIDDEHPHHVASIRSFLNLFNEECMEPYNHLIAWSAPQAAKLLSINKRMTKPWSLNESRTLKTYQLTSVVGESEIPDSVALIGSGVAQLKNRGEMSAKRNDVFIKGRALAGQLKQLGDASLNVDEAEEAIEWIIKAFGEKPTVRDMALKEASILETNDLMMLAAFNLSETNYEAATPQERLTADRLKGDLGPELVHVDSYVKPVCQINTMREHLRRIHPEEEYSRGLTVANVFGNLNALASAEKPSHLLEVKMKALLSQVAAEDDSSEEPESPEDPLFLTLFASKLAPELIVDGEMRLTRTNVFKISRLMRAESEDALKGLAKDLLFENFRYRIEQSENNLKVISTDKEERHPMGYYRAARVTRALNLMVQTQSIPPEAETQLKELATFLGDPLPEALEAAMAEVNTGNSTSPTDRYQRVIEFIGHLQEVYLNRHGLFAVVDADQTKTPPVWDIAFGWFNPTLSHRYSLSDGGQFTLHRLGGYFSPPIDARTINFISSEAIINEATTRQAISIAQAPLKKLFDQYGQERVLHALDNPKGDQLSVPYLQEMHKWTLLRFGKSLDIESAYQRALRDYTVMTAAGGLVRSKGAEVRRNASLERQRQWNDQRASSITSDFIPFAETYVAAGGPVSTFYKDFDVANYFPSKFPTFDKAFAINDTFTKLTILSNSENPWDVVDEQLRPLLAQMSVPGERSMPLTSVLFLSTLDHELSGERAVKVDDLLANSEALDKLILRLSEKWRKHSETELRIAAASALGNNFLLRLELRDDHHMHVTNLAPAARVAESLSDMYRAGELSQSHWVRIKADATEAGLDFSPLELYADTLQVVLPNMTLGDRRRAMDKLIGLANATAFGPAGFMIRILPLLEKEVAKSWSYRLSKVDALRSPLVIDTLEEALPAYSGNELPGGAGVSVHPQSGVTENPLQLRASVDRVVNDVMQGRPRFELRKRWAVKAYGEHPDAGQIASSLLIILKIGALSEYIANQLSMREVRKGTESPVTEKQDDFFQLTGMNFGGFRSTLFKPNSPASALFAKVRTSKDAVSDDMGAFHFFGLLQPVLNAPKPSQGIYQLLSDILTDEPRMHDEFIVLVHLLRDKFKLLPIRDASPVTSSRDPAVQELFEKMLEMPEDHVAKVFLAIDQENLAKGLKIHGTHVEIEDRLAATQSQKSDPDAEALNDFKFRVGAKAAKKVTLQFFQACKAVESPAEWQKIIAQAGLQITPQAIQDILRKHGLLLSQIAKAKADAAKAETRDKEAWRKPLRKFLETSLRDRKLNAPLWDAAKLEIELTYGRLTPAVQQAADSALSEAFASNPVRQEQEMIDFIRRLSGNLAGRGMVVFVDPGNSNHINFISVDRAAVESWKFGGSDGPEFRLLRMRSVDGPTQGRPNINVPGVAVLESPERASLFRPFFEQTKPLLPKLDDLEKALMNGPQTGSDASYPNIASLRWMHRAYDLSRPMSAIENDEAEALHEVDAMMQMALFVGEATYQKLDEDVRSSWEKIAPPYAHRLVGFVETCMREKEESSLRRDYETLGSFGQPFSEAQMHQSLILMNLYGHLNSVMNSTNPSAVMADMFYGGFQLIEQQVEEPSLTLFFQLLAERCAPELLAEGRFPLTHRSLGSLAMALHHFAPTDASLRGLVLDLDAHHFKFRLKREGQVFTSQAIDPIKPGQLGAYESSFLTEFFKDAIQRRHFDMAAFEKMGARLTPLLGALPNELRTAAIDFNEAVGLSDTEKLSRIQSVITVAQRSWLEPRSHFIFAEFNDQQNWDVAVGTFDLQHSRLFSEFADHSGLAVYAVASMWPPAPDNRSSWTMPDYALINQAAIKTMATFVAGLPESDRPEKPFKFPEAEKKGPLQAHILAWIQRLYGGETDVDTMTEDDTRRVVTGVKLSALRHQLVEQVYRSASPMEKNAWEAEKPSWETSLPLAFFSSFKIADSPLDRAVNELNTRKWNPPMKDAPWIKARAAQNVFDQLTRISLAPEPSKVLADILIPYMSSLQQTEAGLDPQIGFLLHILRNEAISENPISINDTFSTKRDIQDKNIIDLSRALIGASEESLRNLAQRGIANNFTLRLVQEDDGTISVKDLRPVHRWGEFLKNGFWPNRLDSKEWDYLRAQTHLWPKAQWEAVDSAMHELLHTDVSGWLPEEVVQNWIPKLRQFVYLLNRDVLGPHELGVTLTPNFSGEAIKDWTADSQRIRRVPEKDYRVDGIEIPYYDAIEPGQIIRDMPGMQHPQLGVMVSEPNLAIDARRLLSVLEEGHESELKYASTARDRIPDRPLRAHEMSLWVERAFGGDPAFEDIVESLSSMTSLLAEQALQTRSDALALERKGKATGPEDQWRSMSVMDNKAYFVDAYVKKDSPAAGWIQKTFESPTPKDEAEKVAAYNVLFVYLNAILHAPEPSQILVLYLDYFVMSKPRLSRGEALFLRLLQEKLDPNSIRPGTKISTSISDYPVLQLQANLYVLEDEDLAALFKEIYEETFSIDLFIDGQEAILIERTETSVAPARNWVSYVDDRPIEVQVRNFVSRMLESRRWDSVGWARLSKQWADKGQVLTPAIVAAVEAVDQAFHLPFPSEFYRTMYELMYRLNRDLLVPLEAVYSVVPMYPGWDIHNFDVEPNPSETFVMEGLDEPLKIHIHRNPDKTPMDTVYTPTFGPLVSDTIVSTYLSSRGSSDKILDLSPGPVGSEVWRAQQMVRKSTLMQAKALAEVGDDEEVFKREHRDISVKRHLGMYLADRLNTRLFSVMPLSWRILMSNKMKDSRTQANPYPFEEAFVRPSGPLALAKKDIDSRPVDSKNRIEPRSNMLYQAAWSTLTGLRHAHKARQYLYIVLTDLACAEFAPDKQTNPEDPVVLYLFARAVVPSERVFQLDDFLEAKRIDKTLKRFSDLIETMTDEQVNHYAEVALKESFTARPVISGHTVHMETDSDLSILGKVALTGKLDSSLFDPEDRALIDKVVPDLVAGYRQERFKPEDFVILSGDLEDESQAKQYLLLQNRRLQVHGVAFGEEGKKYNPPMGWMPFTLWSKYIAMKELETRVRGAEPSPFHPLDEEPDAARLRELRFSFNRDEDVTIMKAFQTFLKHAFGQGLTVGDFQSSRLLNPTNANKELNAPMEVKILSAFTVGLDELVKAMVVPGGRWVKEQMGPLWKQEIKWTLGFEPFPQPPAVPADLGQIAEVDRPMFEQKVDELVVRLKALNITHDRLTISLGKLAAPLTYAGDQNFKDIELKITGILNDILGSKDQRPFALQATNFRTFSGLVKDETLWRLKSSLADPVEEAVVQLLNAFIRHGVTPADIRLSQEIDARASVQSFEPPETEVMMPMMRAMGKIMGAYSDVLDHAEKKWELGMSANEFKSRVTEIAERRFLERGA